MKKIGMIAGMALASCVMAMPVLAGVDAPETKVEKATPKEEMKVAPKEEVKAAPKEEVKAAPKEEVKATPKEEVKATPKAKVEKAAPKEEVKAAPKAKVEKAAPKAAAIDGPALMKELGCGVCHAIDNKKVGPAYNDVAAKYRGQKTYTYNGKEYPLVEGLVMKASKGGKGVWGAMVMPANDPSGKRAADITSLVKFIVDLK